MISGLRGNNYEEKLTELKLESLESRREMFDMVQVYKILHDVKCHTCSNKKFQTCSDKKFHTTFAVT